MVAYSTLITDKGTDGSIKSWVNHDGVPSTTILAEAEAWIYQRLRARQNMTVATGTLTASSDTIGLPTGYRAPRHLMFTATASSAKSIPTRKPLEFVEDNFEYDGSGNRTEGRPIWWATDESNIQFEKLADQNYPYRFRHYRAMPALGTATETNFLTQEYPTLLKAACLYRAYEFLRNEREKLYWRSEAEREIQAVNYEADLERMDEYMVMEVG